MYNSQRISLHPISEKDSEHLRLLRNRDENRKWFLYSEEITKEQQQNWFKKYLLTANDYMFSVISNANSSFIGTVALYNVDENKKTAEVGRIIVDKKITNEKGLGLEVTTAALFIGFDMIGLHTIHLEVFADNIRAISVYKKTGFIQKNQYYKQNKEIIYMEITR